MGYNFFKIIEIPKVVNQKLNDFKTSLEEAVRSGRYIPFADRDINYALMLQRDRLNQKGIQIEYDIYSRDNNRNQFIAGSNWRDAHYESTVCFNSCGIKRRVASGGAIRYKDNLRGVLYETVTDVITGAHPDNDPVCCPNCGAISTVAGIQNGCSYCGTRFQMDELFPKVTSYYFLESPGLTGGEFKSGYLKAYIFAIIFQYVLICILKPEVYLPHHLITNVPTMIGLLFGLLFGSIISGYIFYAYFLFWKLIIGAISNAGKMGTAGSRSRFEARMKRISPEFSYEYFTSKALSLIKTSIFSRDERELLFYEGNPLDPKMKNIIDLNYGGALGVRSFVDEGNFVTVVTKAYFDVLYADENKIHSKSQVFSATFKRRTDIPVNLNFSMTRIACKSCGASFDATRTRNCPYCGSRYEITSDDWALIELKYN